MIPELLRSYLKHHAARQRQKIFRQRIFFRDRENNQELENTPVPAIFIVIMVWSVCAVLLTLSANRQHDLSEWPEQKAPFAVKAQTDFKFINREETERARQEARSAVPEIFSQNDTRSQRLRKQLDELFRQLKSHYDAIQEQRSWSPQADLPSVLAAQASLQLLEAVVGRDSLPNENYTAYINVRREIFNRGILQEKDSTSRSAGQQLRTVDSHQRYSMNVFQVREIPTPGEAAQRLAKALLPRNPAAAQEFAQLLKKLFGDEGTLKFNAELTNAQRDKAAAAVKDVVQSCRKGEVIVSKGEEITPTIREMLRQEKKILPHGSGIRVFYYRMFFSFVLVLATLFFLYRLYPELFADPLQFLLGGLCLILALLANYWAIQGFGFLFRESLIRDAALMNSADMLLIGAVPAMLGAVLVSAFLGNRAAIAAGFLISSATSMMVMPERSFELALRWMAISMLGAFLVRNVTNYRSYFLRILFGCFLLTAAVTSDLIFLAHRSWTAVGYGLFVILLNAFFCAVAALLLVFLFEVIFNASTNMALMVLCDYNHALLERLKREAPGTMFHSMSVATLAEDAARKIGANPLKAKAGALFHDIGKLQNPQYFTENNRDSANIHLNLNPQHSCNIIREHVKDGLILAQEYRLCRFVRSAIATHHGDDLVGFFYNRALAQAKNGSGGGPAVLESQFRYTGLPPCGKELTILSLADACEAACRSLNKPTPGKIQAMVNDIFVKRLQGRQLRNSDLTLAELHKVRDCFVATLCSIHHGRIAYQPEEMYESASKPLDAPAAAPAGK